MQQKNCISSLAAAFALSLITVGLAKASPITHNFTATATSGPLSGTIEHGTFSYDFSSIVPGGVNLATGLLTSLSFSWNGIAYDQTTANTGNLAFDASGNLIDAEFGTNCIAFGCSAFGIDSWFISGIPPFISYNTSAGFGGGSANIAPAVAAPEPTTLALLGIGCALVGAARRSHRGAVISSIA